MSQTWVAGYEVAFTLDGSTVIPLTATNVEVNPTINTNTKPLLGNAQQITTSGQAGGTWSADGIASQEVVPILHDLAQPDASDVAVAITWWGTGDVWTFDTSLSDLSISAAADGDVEWSVSGSISGAIAES